MFVKLDVRVIVWVYIKSLLWMRAWCNEIMLDHETTAVLENHRRSQRRGPEGPGPLQLK